MKICENGIVREMTTEEIAKIGEDMDEIHPTPEQRISDLEDALSMILEGATA